VRFDFVWRVQVAVLVKLALGERRVAERITKPLRHVYERVQQRLVEVVVEAAAVLEAVHDSDRDRRTVEGP
jgi:hypothetical protein